MTKPARKPRRAVWGALIGGLAGVALILGLGEFAVAIGEPAGPGRTATWPAGTEIAVVRPQWHVSVTRDYSEVACTVIPEGGQRARDSLFLNRRTQPNFAGSAAVSCAEPVTVLTDPWLTIAINAHSREIGQRNLALLPLVVAGVAAFVLFTPVDPLSGQPLPSPRRPRHPRSRP